MTTCATCNHPEDQHTDTVGCLVETSSTSYCTCPRFVPLAEPVMVTRQQAASALGLGRALRDEGAARAGDGAPGVLAADWRRKADDALNALAASGAVFSADDLVERAGMPPVANMLGGVFLAARRANRIEAVGFAQATRPESHARVQRTWKGAL